MAAKTGTEKKRGGSACGGGGLNGSENFLCRVYSGETWTFVVLRARVRMYGGRVGRAQNCRARIFVTMYMSWGWLLVVAIVLLAAVVGLWTICYVVNARAISERVEFERRRHPNVNACCELTLTPCDRYRIRRPNSCVPHCNQAVCPNTGDLGGCGRDCGCGHPRERACRLCEHRKCGGSRNPCGCSCGCGRTPTCRSCERQKCGGPRNPCGCRCGCGQTADACSTCEQRQCGGPHNPCGCSCGCRRTSSTCRNCERRQCGGPERPCGCDCGCEHPRHDTRDSDWQYETDGQWR